MLLAVNLVLLYCYIRRRAARHLFGKAFLLDPSRLTIGVFIAGSPPPGSRARQITSVFQQKEDIPFIIIMTVSVIGVPLLLVNIVLVSCFVHKRCRLNNDGRIIV